MRHRSGHSRCRSGQDFRGVPAGRQLDHAPEGRHRSRPVDRQAHHRDARRADLGGIRAGQGIDVLFHTSGAGRSTSGTSMRKRVLVIEDQEDNRQILQDLLTSADFEVIEAVDGEAGVAAAAAQRPDLILMDIQLPLLDGYEATRRIKADPALRAIPIIVITSYALSGDDEKARAAGWDAYFSKPFSPRQLLAKVREYLSPGAPTG